MQEGQSAIEQKIRLHYGPKSQINYEVCGTLKRVVCVFEEGDVVP